MKRSSILAAAAILACGASLAAAQDKVSLKWKYTPGVYVMTIVQDTQNIVSMGENSPKIPSKQKMTMAIEMEIEKPSDQNQTIYLTYKRIQMEASSPMTKAAYDSAAPDAGGSMLAGPLGGLIDQRLTFVLDANGEVKEVKGIDEMWDKIVKSDPRMAGMGEAMKKQFGEGMFKQMFTQQQMMLPDNAVGKGDTWTKTNDIMLPMVGAVTMTQDCAIKDLQKSGQGSLATITSEGKIKGKEAETKAVDFGSMKLSVENIDLATQGTNQFDSTLGMFTSGDGVVKGSMTMSTTPQAGPNGQISGPMKMRMDVDSNVKMSLKPGKYVPPASAPAAKPADPNNP